MDDDDDDAVLDEKRDLLVLLVFPRTTNLLVVKDEEDENRDPTACIVLPFFSFCSSFLSVSLFFCSLSNATLYPFVRFFTPTACK